MRPRTHRLVPVVALIAILVSLTACTSSSRHPSNTGATASDQAQPTPVVPTLVSPSVGSAAPGSASNSNAVQTNLSVNTGTPTDTVTDRPSGTNTYQPNRPSATACQIAAGDTSVVTVTDNCSKIPASPGDCLETPASAQPPPISGQAANLGWTCHTDFYATVNFSYLGNTSSCNASNRPCAEPLRAQSDFATAPYNSGVFAPVEGRDTLHVICQQRGANNLLSSGYLRDLQPDGTLWYSQIYDKVAGVQNMPGVTLPGGYGFANDVWLGNMGWRGIPCTS